MHTITLISHAWPASEHNTKTITYFDGKPETIVEGDCEGFRMREPTEVVHYREDEDNSRCAICGKRALVWLSSSDRHAIHSARCQP
jgi:hypothetical protein